MVAVPEIGFRQSVKKHNCDLAVVCDWIETSLLSDETEVSSTKVGDILHEQGFYLKDSGQQTAHCRVFLDMIWTEMRRRERLLGKAGVFTVTSMRITRVRPWRDCSEYCFLLILACADYFTELRSPPLNNYIGQGELFEDFCCESLAANGWPTTRTGWASHQGAQKLPKTVAAVATAVDEGFVNAPMVDLCKHENEAGCDLVSHWPYADRWTGRPIMLVQCASGMDFKQKLGTPDVVRWGDFIAFSTTPLRGFCTPLAFGQEPFRGHCSKVKGVLLDRFRLIQPFAPNAQFASAPLRKRLVRWMRPRIKAIPVLQ